MARRPSALDTLQDSLAVVFHQAQLTTANHRKNCVSLYKLHVQASDFTEDGPAVKHVGERLFGDIFIDMVNRILTIKKGTAPADRIVKFIGDYVKFIIEKACEQKADTLKHPSSPALINEDDDDFTSRFVALLLTWLLQGFAAKNKVVRFRSVHIISDMISHLGELDEDLYNALRSSLIQRVYDKESLIRMHAVIALSKLAGSENPDDLEKDEQTILEVLLDILQFDPTAEVRRTALIHTPPTASTLPVLLTRTRDTDPITRKLLYVSVLCAKLAHPRQLTISQREQLVKDGLGDREASVRVSAGKMIAAWFDIALAEGKCLDDGNGGEVEGIMRGFVHFLQMFDILGSGEKVAVDALLSIFITRGETLDVLKFNECYWNERTPESVLLARVFIEHCLDTGNGALLESTVLPAVTAFAFHMQESYNSLLGLMQQVEEAQLGEEEDQEEIERREENLAEAEVVLGELLRIAVKLDYSDEVGRRKIFAVVKDMLAHDQLPERLIDCCLDVLSKVSPTERELIRVVVEVVLALREEHDNIEINGDDDDVSHLGDNQSDITRTTATGRERSMRRTKERHDMTPDEAYKADLIDIRCLDVCIGMLERVYGSFEDNSTLEGILADLIIPAVKRKELVMREKGLISLGLSCLIAKNMALSSFQLFLNQVQSSPDELKLKVLYVIFDLLTMYNHDFFGRSEEIANRIITFLLQTLETEESNAVQAILCIGIAKLLISGVVTDPRVLISLVLGYVSPATADNLQLRQCLSYFFPVYCYSAPANQSLMQSIFMTVYDLVTGVHDELDEGQVMISPFQFGLLFLDWTNPQKAANFEQADGHVHVDLAVDILKALYDSDRKGEDQKNLCQLLGHLYLPLEMETQSLLKLNILISNLQKQCPLDKPAEKAMNQFISRFNKSFSEELELLDEQKYIGDPEIRALYEFIGIAVPEECDANEVLVCSTSTSDLKGQRSANSTRRQTRSQRMGDIRSNGSSEDEALQPPPIPKRSKGKEKEKVKATTASHLKTVGKQRSGKPLPSDHEASPNELEAGNEDGMGTAPITPKKKGSKRLLTPASKHSTTSPQRKKQNRVQSPRRKPVRATKRDPFSATLSEENSDGGNTNDGKELGCSGIYLPRTGAITDTSSDDLMGYSEL